MSGPAVDTNFSTASRSRSGGRSRNTRRVGGRLPRWVTKIAWRHHWFYIRTRRKWKFRSAGRFLVVSYRVVDEREISDTVAAREEAAKHPPRGTFEYPARRPERDQLRTPLAFQEGWPDLRLPGRGED